MTAPRLLAVLLLLVGCAASRSEREARTPRGERATRQAQDAREPVASRYADSLVPHSADEARLRPVATIADERIDESSGLAHVAGAYWTHNDSGGKAVLYYAGTPDFAGARTFGLPGARAVDWEELATDGGDIVVCDVGDNFRKRDDLTLYRVRPGSGGLPPQLVATYPVAFEDGPHDCEAVAFIDGKLHALIKNRGEDAHGLYRCDELVADKPNVLVRVGALELPDGEQATAMDVHEGERTLAVLTYSQVLFFSLDDLFAPPVRTVTLHARQCEALCFVGDALVFDNEQRDVFRVEDVLRRPETRWLPERPSLELKEVSLPRSGAVSVFPQMELLPELPLTNLRPSEFLRFGLAGDNFVLDGRFTVEGEAFPTAADSKRIGTAVIVAFAREPRLKLASDDVQVAVIADATGRVRMRAVDLTSGKTPALGSSGMSWRGRLAAPVFEFQVTIAVERVFPDGLPKEFLMNVVGNGLRTGNDEPVLSGFDFFSLLRPYMSARFRAPAVR